MELYDNSTLEKIQEEIKAKVFERYSEIQGVKTQANEMNATLDALHEVTQIPMSEIERIAAEVAQKHGLNKGKAGKTVTNYSPDSENSDALIFSELSLKVASKRRLFLPHLVSYVCTITMLTILNIMTSHFPWVMFVIGGWTIGLVSHYLKDVYYPRRDLHNAVNYLKSQIQLVINEMIITDDFDNTQATNGIYRILAAGCKYDTLFQYLQKLFPQVESNVIALTAHQLVQVRDNIVNQTQSLFIEQNHPNRKRNSQGYRD